MKCLDGVTTLTDIRGAQGGGAQPPKMYYRSSILLLYKNNSPSSYIFKRYPPLCNDTLTNPYIVCTSSVQESRAIWNPVVRRASFQRIIISIYQFTINTSRACTIKERQILAVRDSAAADRFILRERLRGVNSTENGR